MGHTSLLTLKEYSYLGQKENFCGHFCRTLLSKWTLPSCHTAGYSYSFNWLSFMAR